MQNKTSQKVVAPESLLKDADYQKVSAFEKIYKQIKTLNDPRFGEISILQNPQTRQAIAVREKKVTDKAEAGRLILAARSKVSLVNPNLVNLLDYSVIKQSELCSSFYIIKYFFEYPKSDLRKQIQDREKTGQGFNGNELTHLLYQQIQTQSYLQSQSLAHGDVQPLYIGYDVDKQESKLIDKSDGLINEASIVQTQKNRLISGQPIYQSPTMYSNLKKGNLKFQFDKNKEDAFALGLVILEAGNDKSVQNIYDSKSGNVDQAALNKHLDEFNRKFGTQNALLTSHVSSLTNANEATRPSPAQVQSTLPPYDEVKKYLVSGSSPNELSHSSFRIPGDQNTTTHTLIQGGDTKTTINQKVDMPDVNYNLFNMEIKDNPFLVQSQTEYWDNTLVNPKPKVLTIPSNQNHFTPRYSNKNLANSQLMYDYEEEVKIDHHDQPKYVNAELPVSKGNTLVYDDAPDAWQNESLVNSNYIPSSYVHQKVYANAPVAQSQSTYNTYNAPIQSQVTYSQHKKDYLTNPEVKHEYRLHDSTITQPEVINGGSHYTQPSIIRPRSSRTVYTNSTPTNYTSSNNVVYQEAPVTTVYQNGYNRPSYSQHSVKTVYTEAPRSTVTYSQAVVYPETPKSAVHYTNYIETPKSTVHYTNYPATQKSTVLYAKNVGSTIYNEQPLYEQSRPQTIYTQAPITNYTSVNEPLYNSNYLSQNRVIIEGESTPVPRHFGYAANQSNVNTQVISNNANLDVTGLKFVKSYSDNRFATERANHQL